MTLTTKWNNPIFDPNLLTAGNVLSYFCHRSNPFYSTQSNNEKQIMSRNPNMDLTQYQGDEYSLYHAQEPVLFIIVKSRRRSPTNVTPLSYYIIINGEVIQAPDISSVINARLQTSIFHINESFQLLFNKAKHNPSNGTYTWEDVNANNNLQDRYANYGNQFQTNNMSHLLYDWMAKFPYGGGPGAQSNALGAGTQSQSTVQNNVQPPSSTISSVPPTCVSTPSMGSHTPRSTATQVHVPTSQQLSVTESNQPTDVSPAPKRPRII